VELAAEGEEFVRAIVAATILTMLPAVFCRPIAAQTAPPTFLYLLEGRGTATGTIHAFSTSAASGAITEVPGSPFTAGLIPEQLAIDPTARFLYVTNQQSQDITGFSIDASTGALTVLPGSPFFIGSQPVALGIDPTGRFLYVSTIGAPQPSLYEFTIDPSAGFLTLAPTSPQPGLSATSIAFNSVGGYAYLSQGSPDPGSSRPVVICAINFSTGMLTPIGSIPPVTGGASVMAASPGANLLYSVDSANSNVDAFTVSSAGQTLQETTGSPYPVPFNPQSLTMGPSGNFLYVVNENHAYQTNYAASQYTGDVSAFAINPGTGALVQVPGSPFAAGTNPVSVVVDPTGSFVYTTSTMYTSGYSGFAQVEGFSIDPSSGSLTPLPGIPWTDSVVSTGGQLAITSAPVTAPNPVPVISSLSPPSTTANAVAFTLQVGGANFIPGSTVYFGGKARVTTFVSPSQLDASILASDVNDSGTAAVVVFNPLPGGGASVAAEFAMSAAVPVISSSTPSTVVAGSPGFSLAVRGSNFVTSSAVILDGTAVVTTYIGPTLVLGQVLRPLIAAPATIGIAVASPANGVPGGGMSNTATLSVVPSVIPLAISSMSPASGTAGEQAFTLVVNGTGFVQGSQVSFQLNNVTTTFVNATQLTASIPVTAVAVAGRMTVIATNPDGSASAPVPFVVNNPTPVGSAVVPALVAAGSSALTLNVAGTGFTASSAILVNGSTRVTAYLNTNLLQGSLLPSDLAQSGTLNITVTNPAPGGGTAPSLGLMVADYDVSAPSPTQIVSAGQAGNYSLLLAALNGTLGHSVTFTASGLPPMSSVSFSPPSVAAGKSSANVMLSVITTARSSGSTANRLTDRWPRRPVLAGMALAMGIIWFAGWTFAARMREAAPILLTVFLLAIAISLVACNSFVGAPPVAVNPSTGTPAGTYAITVDANSGGVTISTKVVLTVM
jgi:6-phosphogluconolactonase (cycloisomerase 2 family)